MLVGVMQNLSTINRSDFQRVIAIRFTFTSQNWDSNCHYFVKISFGGYGCFAHHLHQLISHLIIKLDIRYDREGLLAA